MRFMRNSFFLLLIIIQCAFSQTGIFLGKITDEDTGNPVEGARIRILGTGHATTSNQNGAYKIIYDIRDNYYIIEFTGDGYQDRVIEDVIFLAGDTLIFNVALIPTRVGVNTVTTRSTSRRPENAVEAPASVSIINRESIEPEVVLSSDIFLRNALGTDVATTGLDRREISIRGFNGVFNAYPYVLTDYRQAAVPSLGVNLYAMMPILASDLYRIEIVRDPSAALYGIGAESGVVHYISKSPLTHPGLDISVGAGERLAAFGNFRGAVSLFGRVGFKLTGQYTQGNNWELNPGDRFDRRQLDTDAPGVIRNYDYRKMNANGELQFKIMKDVVFTASGGFSSLKDNVMSTLGTAYADSLVYTYAQARLKAGRFFAQGYLNRIQAGELFFYGLNVPMVDRGEQMRGQAQYDFPFSRWRSQLVVGADVNMTTPQTERTIYGRNEDNDRINETGVYLHFLRKQSPKYDFTLALRGDYNDFYESVTVSPRVGIVYKPDKFRSLRLTFNRSSALPAHPSLFLDVPLSETILNENGAYKLIFQGRGAGRGFSFNTFRDDRQVTMMAALPHLSQNPFGQSVSLDQYPVGWAYLNTAFATEAMFSGPQENIPPDLRTLDATQQQALVQLLNLMGEQTLACGETTRGILGIPDNSNLGYKQVEGPQDVPALKMPTTNTLELGYKGILGNRFQFSLDGFYSIKQNFVSLVRLETPLVYLPVDYIRSQVIDFVAAGDPQVNLLIQQLGIGRSSTVGLMTTLYSQTPSGIVQPDAGEDGSGVLPVSYPNAVGGLLTYRNFGKVQYWGFDLGMQFLATYKLVFFGNLSLVSDNFFDNKELKESNTDLSLALNAPTFKTQFGFVYNNPEGAAFGMSARYIHSFPVQAGPYVGGLPAPYGNGIGGIEGYFILDMNLGYSLKNLIPGLRFDITVNNLFNYVHREFVGAPEIGRLALARVGFSF